MYKLINNWCPFYSIITELLNIFRENVNSLYKASEAIALLDMLCSFSFSKISSDYGNNYIHIHLVKAIIIKLFQIPL
jgi:predicted HNH restriction endonuclease